jgi:hypothetical protein
VMSNSSASSCGRSQELSVTTLTVTADLRERS